MKSLLILIFVSTITVLTIAQEVSIESNKIVIEQHDTEKNTDFKVEVIDGGITYLKVNGKVVDSSLYDDHDSLLSKYFTINHDSDVSIYMMEAKKESDAYMKKLNEDKANDVPRDSNDEIDIALRTHLVKQGYISDENNYTINLKHNSLKVNGEKMDRKTIEKCIAIYEDLSGFDMSKETKITIKKSKNSKSISVHR